MSFEPKLKFFEHKLNDPYPPFNERVYAESFEKEKTAGIGWELHSSFTSTNFPITLGMSWRLQKSDGTYTQDYPSDVHIDKGWSSLWLTRAWGYKDNGKLPIGTYTFEVAVSENITIKSSFTIV